MKFVLLIVASALMPVFAHAQETPTPHGHSATESLSRRFAELRRGDGYAIADFFGQQRFRAGKDRWKNGRIFPESAHLIQARARDAKDRRGRSMDARSGAGDLHHLHNQRRRPETDRRCAGQSRRAGKIKMDAVHVAAGIRGRAFSFCRSLHSEAQSRKRLGTPSGRRHAQSAERFAVRS